MDRFAPTPADARQEPIRTDWVRISVIAGFIATFMMTAAITAGFLFANAVGDEDGGTVARWFAALSGNEIVDQVGDAFAVGMVINLIVGLIWALIYGKFAEPVLNGRGWPKGVIFAMAPFLLSILVVFPIMGAGFLGAGIGAGPLPVLGNLIAHVVFGAVLGFFYAIEEGSGISGDASEHQASASSERGTALGILIGGVVGAIGGYAIAPTMDDLASRPVLTLAGVLTGAAIGALIGSLTGMTTDEDTAARADGKR
ncbi:hypothetical protein BH23CHL3_BH23CHL3_10240 [soil metagenome]